MKKLTWAVPAALCLGLATTAYGQLPDFSVPESEAPAEVKQALRERVNQFFQFHVGTVNRKAIDLVAEDTKDYYFSSGKMQFLSYSVIEIHFTKDLQKASVKLETTQIWNVQQYSTVATTPVVTSWKVEDGKWVWFLDNQILAQGATPMGASAPPPPKQEGLIALTNPDGTLNLPKDFAAPERVSAQGQAILQQAGLDKDSVTFTLGTAGEDQVTFHNGFTGQISLVVYEVPQVPGLTVKLDKSDLERAENGILRFSYKPVPGETAPALGRQYTVRLNLIPTGQEFPIRLTLLGTR